MDPIEGTRVRLRLATESDVETLVAIRRTPAVYERWRGDDIPADLRTSIAEEELHFLAIEDRAGTVIGAIQWDEEEDPDYRHARLDVFIDPAVHRRGYGVDAITALVRHLFEREGHHRLTIDPAADNLAAIRCYAKAGFREVGVMRRYERGAAGDWHDGLLMELLADDFD